MNILQEVAAALEQVKKTKPLVHHLTNFVTANDSANMTLAIGASPVMANDVGEVEEMVAQASALVLNLGTLQSRTIDAMLAAGRKAAAVGVPVVLDPVGVGATALRTSTAERIIREVRPAVIRGNMSEIKVLAGLEAGIKGVDSLADEQGGDAVALSLSKRLDCVVAITGRTDIIAWKNKICRVHNGHIMLAGVTGTGCMATSLIGSCCGAVNNPFIGAVAGIAVMSIAGEIAQRLLKPEEGLGTFRMRLFDTVSNLTPEVILQYGKFTLKCE